MDITAGYLLVEFEPAGEPLAVLVTQPKVPDLPHSNGPRHQVKQVLPRRLRLETGIIYVHQSLIQTNT